MLNNAQCTKTYSMYVYIQLFIQQSYQNNMSIKRHIDVDHIRLSLWSSKGTLELNQLTRLFQTELTLLVYLQNDLKVARTDNLGEVIISFIQTKAYDSVDVNYTLTFAGQLQTLGRI